MTTIITRKNRAHNLRKQRLPNGYFWLEQNINKINGKWTPLAKEGHKIYHLMHKYRGYAGRIKIDDKIYFYDEAERIFLV